jgi:hypothetical protein
VWASAAELEDGVGDTREAGLIGWIPTGEPDLVDPDLVNRLC